MRQSHDPQGQALQHQHQHYQGTIMTTKARQGATNLAAQGMPGEN